MQSSTENNTPTLPTAALIGGIGLLAAAAPAEDKRAASDPLKNVNSDSRSEWFKESPDPWKEVERLTFGGDRTLASGLQTLIQDADPAQWPDLESKLLDVLHSKHGTEAARDFVCRMLRLIGSPASLKGLVPLLENNQESDRARYALQGIVGSEVDAALRAALPKLSGHPKAGLIGTLAVRGDRAAVPALESIQQDVSEPASVRDAAKQALAHLKS